MKPDDLGFMEEAFRLAKESFDEGGIPIGSVLVRDGNILGKGHNQRVQKGNPILHGEMDCLQNAGRPRSYRSTTIYTTLSPCPMCSGAIALFGIPRVVIGENRNYRGYEDFLRDRGVEVIILNHQGCYDLLSEFVSTPTGRTIFNEDTGKT